MKRFGCVGILLILLCPFSTFLCAQPDGRDVRAKRESDRAKEERAKDDRRATDMKAAEKKADPNFWAQQNSKSKSAAQMSADLRAKTDKNSVPFTTPTTKGHIDLAGKTHFDKDTKAYIPPPHVQTQEKAVGPNGKVNYGRETIRPATKQDIRTAQKIVDRKQ